MSGYPVRKIWRREEFPTQVEYEHALFLSWFGRLVFDVRQQVLENQMEFAKRLGIGQCQVSQLENGCVDFKIGMLLKIAAHLEVDPRELFPDSKDLEQEAYVFLAAEIGIFLGQEGFGEVGQTTRQKTG